MMEDGQKQLQNHPSSGTGAIRAAPQAAAAGPAFVPGWAGTPSIGAVEEKLGFGQGDNSSWSLEACRDTSCCAGACTQLILVRVKVVEGRDGLMQSFSSH